MKTSAKGKAVTKTKKDTTSIKGKTTIKKENKTLLSNVPVDTSVSLIETFGQPQAYIIQDSLATNDILNESLKLLSAHQSSVKKQIEEETNPQVKSNLVKEAAYDVRTNALSIAQLVQAKCALFKQMKP